MKRVIRTLLAEACRASLLLKAAEGRVRSLLTILCYHRVLPADKRRNCVLPALAVTPELLRRQCRLLQHTYDVRPLHTAVEAFQRGATPGRPLAAITFDDGYQDNYYYAAPVLRQFGLKATFFVISDLIGIPEVPWYDRLGRAADMLRRQGRTEDLLRILAIFKCPDTAGAAAAENPLLHTVLNQAKKMDPSSRKELTDSLCTAAGNLPLPLPEDRIMDWDQLTTLANQGHEIGSHGGTHEILPQLNDESLRREVQGSRQCLERHLDKPVRSFCYPNGNADERVVRVVRSAGYACAVTVRSGGNRPGQDIHRLNRRFIHEGRLSGPYERASSLLLRMELCGLADYVFGRKGFAGNRG
jgi:peptidoglycan/xylan/chitin deacetylase (PgdA/CDA1 family)